MQHCDLDPYDCGQYSDDAAVGKRGWLLDFFSQSLDVAEVSETWIIPGRHQVVLVQHYALTECVPKFLDRLDLLAL